VNFVLFSRGEGLSAGQKGGNVFTEKEGFVCTEKEETQNQGKGHPSPFGGKHSISKHQKGGRVLSRFPKEKGGRG